MTASALLLLDTQVNMFAQPGGVYQAEACLQRLAQLANLARQQRIPLFFVMNEGGPGDPDEPGSPGWMLQPELGPAGGDIVLAKHTPDAFMGTQLYELLEENEIERLVIAGMQTELCITQTCQRAHDLGYQVALVSDCHTTFDFPGGVPAAQLIEVCNANFRTQFAVVPLEQVRFD